MNPHQQAVKQLEQVAALLADQYQDQAQFKRAIEQLKTPDQVHQTELAVEMDDGTIRKFTAFRSQHNNARGPYKGGIRFHQNVSKEEVMALSTWMTWKCAVTGIPYGGSKGGVIVNPKELSATELERLSRAYSEFVAEFVGPWVDVPAPDVNTTPQIMAWMVDAYEKYLQKNNRPIQENPLATFTGKPLGLGGSAGRTEATGLGGFFVFEKLVEKLGLTNKSEVSIAIQGLGNVGYWFAYHAHQAGYKVVAVSDSKGGIYDPAGLDPVKIFEYKQENGELPGEKITNQALLELDVDVLVPAALENVITKDNAAHIKAKAVLEMANGPTSTEADEILAQNQVVLVPDVLANAGGVTVSYFEWVQNLQGYYWTKEEVVSKLQPLMEDAFAQMWSMKESKSVSGRMATYLSAVKRVVDTMVLRGI